MKTVVCKGLMNVSLPVRPMLFMTIAAPRVSCLGLYWNELTYNASADAISNGKYVSPP